MTTIEIKADDFAHEKCCRFCFYNVHCEEFCDGYKYSRTIYEKIAKDQREADIEAAQKHICKTFCKALALTFGSETNCDRCKAKEMLRKSMEED